jgi:tripartite-type tricarboxylate transporter receptor subunit TctC
MNRVRLRAIPLSIALTLTAAGVAQAQRYPNEPVRFLVGFAPGQ